MSMVGFYQKSKYEIFSENDIANFINTCKKSHGLIRLGQVENIAQYIFDKDLCSSFFQQCFIYNVNQATRLIKGFRKIDSQKDIEDYIDSYRNKAHKISDVLIDRMANCIENRDLRSVFKNECCKFNQNWVKEYAGIKKLYILLKKRHLVSIENQATSPLSITQAVNKFQLEEKNRLEELVIAFGLQVQRRSGTFEELDKLSKQIDKALITPNIKDQLKCVLNRYKTNGYLHFAGGAGSISTSNSVYHIYNRNGKK